MDARMGLGVHFISTRRHAQGVRESAQLAISDEEVADTQAKVDELASLFFVHVAASRGLTVDAVDGFEGGTFYGASAVKAGES